jgi:tetratricopeptide (TPR) repeat protein
VQPAEPAAVGPPDINQPVGLPIPATPASPPSIAPTAIAPARRWAWPTWLPIVGVTGLVMLGAVWGIGRSRDAGLTTPPATDSIPNLAVGWISDYSAGSAAQYSRALSDMLATNLARSPAVRVLSTARVYELIRQLNSGDDSSSGAVLAAARAAGATAVIDGALYELAPGRFRLDLRRVDLVTGDVIDAHQVVGATLFELADSGTARLLDGLGARALPGGLAEVTTRSLDAYRLYEEGLRLFYAGRKEEAETRFVRSLREDPDFALAALYAARTVEDTRIGWMERMAQARRASARATERERLIIQAEWAFNNTNPRLRAYAESLVTRYPQELEGHLYLGNALLMAGEFEAARRPLHVVIAMDSLGLRTSGEACAGCRSIPALAYSYDQADSLDATLQILKLWTRLQPGLARAWWEYGLSLARSQRFDEAAQMLAIGDSLAPRDERRVFYRAVARLWEGSTRAAESILRPELRQGSPTHRHSARWYLVIALRNAGQLDEALIEAHRYRATFEFVPGAPNSVSPGAVAEAWVRFEQGDAVASATLFDSIVRYRMPAQDSTYHARHVIWNLSHAAAGYAVLRDTMRLLAIRDTIHLLAPQSLYGRDQLLEYYVNGLLWRLRGNRDSAIVNLRRAIFSPSLGYTRVNLVLGEVLLEAGDPLGAVAVLAPGLRGSVEGSSYYVTQRLLHQRLGEAWQRAGNADSASYHREWAAKLGR